MCCVAMETCMKSAGEPENDVLMFSPDFTAC